MGLVQVTHGQMTVGVVAVIKVMIPDMPTVRELYPYLKLIDDNHIYVNRGPLVSKLEDVLSDMVGVPCVTTSNGTVALELALQAMNVATEIFTPALTFRATGLAASRSTYNINLVDVTAGTLQMQPITHMYAMQMPVATFGRPVSVPEFEYGICPTIIDAAGAFPAQKVSKLQNFITCFSLHATKFVGCGEGGFVASANAEVMATVRDLSTFGNHGTNAKMSEYHAAIALASLQRLPAKMERTEQRIEWYLKHGLQSLGHVPYLTSMTTLLNIVLHNPVDDVALKLLAAGIETKQWYRPYLNELPQFAGLSAVPVTDYLRPRILGLPFHNFMSEDDVQLVCATLGEILAA